MALVKVAVYGSPLKTVYIDTSVGARVDALQRQLDALIAAGSATRHSALQGLQLGDDHPQYTMWAAPETVTVSWNFAAIPLIQGESLAEYIEDVVGGDDFIQDTTSIHWTYNDTAGTLEGNVQNEYVQDVVGAMLTDSSRIDFTYNDASGTFTADLIAGSVTNSFLADMSQATIKGRASGAGTGNPVDLTGTEATAILDTFTSALKGLAPASGGGTANFLRADGSWAAPAGAGGSLTFVAEFEVTGSAATTLVCSGLDLATDECYEFEILIDNGSVSTANISLFLNGDTTATNYDRNICTDGAASPSTNNAIIAALATTTTIWYRGIMRLDFDGRARTILAGSYNNTTSTSGLTGQHLYRTAANITSITISSSVANALSVGSKVIIWKRTT